MGMDYAYDLYFPREAWVDVIEQLGAIAWGGSDERMTLDLPGRTLTLPFSAVGGTASHLSWDDPAPAWDFATSLCFDRDDAIDQYLHRFDSPTEAERYDVGGRARIGWIYVTVDRDLSGHPSGTADDLVRFSFGTPGSSMSILFWESPSIRRTFIRLLETCRGVYGVLDREDEADLVWLRGAEVTDVVLPAADLPLAEIEEIVAGAPQAAPTSSTAPVTTPTPTSARTAAGPPVPVAATGVGAENLVGKLDPPAEAWVAAAPVEVEPGVREPSFWTPRNSTCDPRWRRALDRFLMWLLYEPEAKPIFVGAVLVVVAAALWGVLLR